MNINRRDWLKTAFLGSAALTLSPLEFLANETPNFNELKNSNETIRLCFNENPFGTSPKALEAMQKSLSLSSRYDFKLADVLCEKIAGNNNVKKENILVSAGSSFLLELITKYVSLDKGHIIIPDPSFTIFESIAEFLGMSKSVIELNDKKKIDLVKMKSSIQKDTKLIYICNPNNPTGDLLSRAEIENFIKSIPDNIIVLVDEAYIEFTTQRSLSDLVDVYKNLIVTRTFSKLYGFAGARLGYAIGHLKMIENLKKLQSWSGAEISVVTMAGAIAAMDDQVFITKVLDNNQKVKDFTISEFNIRGIKTIPSSANFVYFSLENYKGDYFKKLKEAKILGGKTYEEKGKWTRISLGTIEEMRKYFDVIS
ncbi:aminotransferase class I/II-fold pyridoxal phosphate-dependent enzyme [Epilithonimonas vandammei]|uniref:Aminotransferase class I/II-fold pyridoxal phosphate-dependent enzyme n=1 Tax=Epilithonimonas vandammei TaxID=2487072 RepID=A0A3G8ZDQ1_9FLAO|nr:aminotransferase class I/II-fold pyridoxal phosphate-dependent enzyme [Epilithonimonas vandammei]AZI55283.1 aminotransferase class I/II-fold pyridoxal phosphate-dependent enzyme [Epilithonimonas vandammei]